MPLQDISGARDAAPRADRDRADRLLDRLRRGLIWLAPFLIALVGYLGAMREMHPPFTADEPHYALEAFSIARDGDVDLTNDYADIARVYAATDDQTTTLQPHAYQYVPGGPLSSMHNAGLPLLLAPAARLSQTVGALQLEMVLLASIAAQLLFSILAKVVPRRRFVCWASWAVVVFSLPLVGYSTRLYPEMPAALLTLGVLRILLSDRLRLWQILLAGLLIGSLPWLHVRFGIVAAGLVLAVLLRMVELRRGVSRRDLALGVAILAVTVLGSLAVMSVEFHRWYGTYSLTVQLHTTDQIATPTAPTAPAARGSATTPPTAGAAATAPSTTPATPATTPAAPAQASSSVFDFVDVSDVIPGLARGLYSSRNGWIPFMPIGVLALAGALALAARARWWVGLGVLVALGYAIEIASTGVLPAYSLPGRYEVIFLPLLAVPLAMVLAQVRWTWALFWPLSVIGAVITLFGMTHTGGLVPFTPGAARADIGSATVLLRAWPTVSREPPQTTSPTYALSVCGGSHPVGTVHGCGAQGYIASTPGAGAGYLWRSAARPLAGNDYAVAVGLQRESGDAADQRLAARIDVVVGGQVVITENARVADITQGAYRIFLRPVRVPDGSAVSVRVFTTGVVRLRVPQASLRANNSPLTGAGTQPDRYPDLPAVLAWTAVLLGLAAAIAVSLPRRETPTA